ncbi:MAG: ribose-phosphate pyrophosphokinase [Candidatus Altiarchaeales archaeon HGW-Altiarchaeales-1]|nr:MAG: ribose-phosphate pyrophosphokinase [Candidatus Altiarchaeales archaeon HGW-Altiarchaeales-1]
MYIFEFGFNVGKKLREKNANLDVMDGEILLKKFPDGEFYARVISNIENEDCVVVQSIYNSDEFLKAILILDAIKRSKAKSINLVIPYLTYMRQDKIFLKGEALSAEVILKNLNSYADKIFLINSHNQQFRKSRKFKYEGIEIYNMDAFSEIAKYFKNLKNPKVISPDEGALDTAKECGKILKCESNYLVKKRDRVTGKIVIEDKNLGVEGKDVLIADDIISSGGTMIEALKIIKKQNPASINLACVHGVFCDNENFLILKTLADELVATNSIPNKVAKIDLSELIAGELAENLIKK